MSTEIPLYLPADVAQYLGKAFGLSSRGCWFEPTVRHYFPSNNVRLLAYVYTGEDTQSKRLTRDESNRIYWLQIILLSLIYMKVVFIVKAQL